MGRKGQLRARAREAVPVKASRRQRRHERSCRMAGLRWMDLLDAVLGGASAVDVRWVCVAMLEEQWGTYRMVVICGDAPREDTLGFWICRCNFKNDSLQHQNRYWKGWAAPTTLSRFPLF
eukprot:scaffold7381_cov310-Pinguiococcus_pyrenoidosus.AAC.69